MCQDDKTKKYTLKSTYIKLQIGTLRKDAYMYKSFWKTKALPSTEFFAWKVC